ncbi:MAG TPA: hypothetical protein VKQ11_22680 [Candidatus Sulfotelmatobacter sp.]|nr:hypothetical protein [Candidatus Sulfotelmatobacter sp.]
MAAAYLHKYAGGNSRISNQSSDHTLGNAPPTPKPGTFSVPHDGTDFTQQFLGMNWRIRLGIGITARQKSRAPKFLHNAMSTEPLLTAKQNDIAFAYGAGARPFDEKDIAGPDSGKHAPTSDLQAHLPTRA